MRKPVVDYKQLRLSKLTDPQFSHLLLLLGWVVYFGLYFITENFIPVEDCHPVHMWLDDVMKFNEWFVIPYVFWYILIVISLGWFALYDVDSFKRLQIFIMITQAIAMVVYIIYPTRQDLRPEVFPRENFLAWIVGIIYQFDTNTGVCPSLHVAYSIGIASVWIRQKESSVLWRGFVVFAVIMICLSTIYIKQHSAVDFFAALPVCLVAELVVHRKFYFRKK